MRPVNYGGTSRQVAGLIIVSAAVLLTACGNGSSASPNASTPTPTASAPSLATRLDSEVLRQIASCVADQTFLSGQPKSAILYSPTRSSIASLLKRLAPYEGDAYLVVAYGHFEDETGSGGAPSDQLWILIPQAALTPSLGVGDTACDLEQLQSWVTAAPDLSALGAGTALPAEEFSRPG